MSIDFPTHILPESILDFHSMLADGKTTVTAVVKAYLGVIDLQNKDVNAYLEVFAQEALTMAENCDNQLSGKNKEEREALFRQKRLFGVPFAVKDNILFKDHKASAASKILEEYVSSYDATVMIKLREAGAICLGRVNMDEFAMGGSTENSAYGVTRNPLNLEYVPGGTSGGSAAAVAMNGCLFAVGSDTGGSIRQPSAYCGVVGLKPTYGGVSRHGLMPMASSFDVIGPITKNIEDAELVFDIIRGVDPLDSTSHSTQGFTVADTAPRQGLRVGIPREFIFTEGVSAEVKKSIEDTVELLKGKGVEVVDISIPLLQKALAMYYILVPAEVSSNMARFDGVRYGSKVDGVDLLGDYMNTRGSLLGKEVRKRIMLGTYILSAGYHDAYYRKASLLRDQLSADVRNTLSQVDAILTPTAPDTAFKIGEKVNDPVSLYLADIFTVTANLCGVPAISVPAKTKTASGLPLGIQFMSGVDKEDILFALGKMIY